MFIIGFEMRPHRVPCRRRVALPHGREDPVMVFMREGRAVATQSTPARFDEQLVNRRQAEAEEERLRRERVELRRRGNGS